MTTNQLEELGDGYSNEYQRVFAQSQSRNAQITDDRGLVQQFVAAGLHVVVQQVERYCPITDATTGYSEYLVSAHRLKSEALAVVSTVEYNEELGLYSPREPEPEPFTA